MYFHRKITTSQHLFYCSYDAGGPSTPSIFRKYPKPFWMDFLAVSRTRNIAG
ncbi:hypothetical protein GPLA_3590 [Paraglaciecola polaris LMG 21857]|uniref:Uncharacterized protein n=1 Tax=Paraglaciecola polaris LMG 21857 TaxID=1129793 RepID=K7A0J5_9ALTE|nr:hypothetical protein GPLA_3590 [Paraglaciecola polaris LMG 21857]